MHSALPDLLHSCRPTLRMVRAFLERDLGTARVLDKRRRWPLQSILGVPELIRVRHLGGRRYLNPGLGMLSAAANPRSLHLDQAI